MKSVIVLNALLKQVSKEIGLVFAGVEIAVVRRIREGKLDT
jgi:hypothetical protein